MFELPMGEPEQLWVWNADLCTGGWMDCFGTVISQPIILAEFLKSQFHKIEKCILLIC
jgi:hypothetical protein